MLTPSLGFVLLVSASIAECRSLFDVKHFHGRYKRQNEDPTGLFLVASAVQSGSASDGSNNGVSAPGQSKSQTSQNNFINYCKGKTLTNGLQVQGGSCNGIPMGDIPSRQNMVSSIITFPLANSATIEEKTDFSISVQMINFVAGSFTNAQETYYSAPQALSGGNVVGHTHVTVQDMGPNLNPKQPLPASAFVFFKGINDAGNGNGLLSASVPGGLPAGNYRVCTMASSSNHQLVLMPVAQRGAQDDCTKFTVVPAGAGGDDGGDGGDDDETVSSSAEAPESSTTLAESSTSAAADISTSATEAPTETSASETSPAETLASETPATETSASETSEIEASATETSASETSEAEASATETPSETPASETSEIEASATETPTESSISETIPILSSSPPPFANSSFVAKTTTSTQLPVTTTSTTVDNGNAQPISSTSLTSVVLSTTTSSIASTTSTTTQANNGNNGGNGNLPPTVSTSLTTSVVKTVAPPIASTTTRKANNGGKGRGGGKKGNNIKGVKGNNNRPSRHIIKIVHKITIIRTFFTFKNSLGGLPPAVNKKGNSFAVLDQLFDNLPSACNAACGAQYKTCISFSGPGFEIVKCKQQRKECGAAASVVTSQAAETPKVVTATVTVPPSASVPGEIIGEETVISTVELPASSVVETGAEPTPIEEEEAAEPTEEVTEPTVIEETQAAAPIETSAPALSPQATESACTLVTETVFVDAPTVALPTATALPIVSRPIFSNSTASATPTLPVAQTSSSASASLPTSAVANIPAPAIEASGDPARPFLVNGNTFTNEAAAKQRSCDIQFNRCADAVNGGKAIGVSVGDCAAQKEECEK